MEMRGRVLVVAGSDSGGGAGIQADIKTITALGAYATTAVTALTAQDTRGVHATFDVPPYFLRRQIEVVLQDIGADAIKIGMLAHTAMIETLCEVLERLAPGVPLVVDPVMVAKGGAMLLDSAAHAALKRSLVLRAAVITPNIPEAVALTGMSIAGTEDMVHAACMLLTLGPRAVLLKGGHLESETVSDVLVTDTAVEVFDAPRIHSRHTHGTGCTLASAIATGLAQGQSLHAAVLRARAYVRRAMEEAPGLGQGCGPLNHAHTVTPFRFEA